MRFWGVRGSVPAPGPHTRRYGGNTPCLEVRCGSALLVFDLGTGVRALGEALARGGAPVEATVFVSHYHHDHLQGLPFFTPLFDPRNRFTVYGAPRDGQDVRALLAGQMRQPYFPVTADEVFRSRVTYRDVRPGRAVRVGEARVRALELNHPGGSLGYRVDFGGRALVYATDVEHGSAADARLADFARGADVLVYDAMYSDDEYRGVGGGPSRVGWGHSTWQAAVAMASAAGVGRLVLFHHDPARSDAEVDRFVRLARRHRPEAIAAAEALVLDV